MERDEPGLTASGLVVALARVRADPRYLANLDWGRARPGHPEGTVRAHVAELEANLDGLGWRLSVREGAAVRLLIHVHDTFKPDAVAGVTITDPRSHASLARSFLSEFVADGDLLNMVQYHDEGYALWVRRLRGRQAESTIARRFERLLGRIVDWDTFLAFCVVDACTAGKSRGPIRWFLGAVAGRVRTRVDESWIVG